MTRAGPERAGWYGGMWYGVCMWYGTANTSIITDELSTN